MGNKKTEFAVGDRVRLLSGGPVMTVNVVYTPIFVYRYRCGWTDSDGNPQLDLFRAEQLELVTGEVTPPETE